MIDQTIKIPLEPMGKQRPRIARRGNFSRAYTPNKTLQWESAAATVIRSSWTGSSAISDPCRVEIYAFRKRTNFMNAKKRHEVKVCGTKPDIDNIAKIVLDSAVRSGVLKDDNLVCELVVFKRWADPLVDGFVEIRFMDPQCSG